MAGIIFPDVRKYFGFFPCRLRLVISFQPARYSSLESTSEKQLPQSCRQFLFCTSSLWRVALISVYDAILPYFFLQSPLLRQTEPVQFDPLPAVPTYRQQRSLPYSTEPESSGVHEGNQTHGKITNFSAVSEPNIGEVNAAGRTTNLSDLSSIHRRLNDSDEPHRSTTVHNFDRSKYILWSDANPMTQTILERVHCSGSMLTLRQNSMLSRQSSSSLRRNSSESDNINGLTGSQFALARKRHKSHGEQDVAEEEDDDDDDDNGSTSSESSSTKSNHTIPISSSSSSSSAHHKSSRAVVRAASSLIHDGKRQLTRLVTSRFLRKSSNKARHGNHDITAIDEDDDDTERLLINDGSNGDLKYKASRNLKEQPQFDKTQLLQTIATAHHGPIWCMR